jgi:hypothetical protein
MTVVSAAAFVVEDNPGRTVGLGMPGTTARPPFTLTTPKTGYDWNGRAYS